MLFRSIFPFASLHPNAGRRLREEILLLPPDLSPSTSNIEGLHTNDHMHIVPITDPLQFTPDANANSAN